MLFFSANQKLSIYRKLYALLSKASRFRNQNTSRSNNFLLSSKTALFYVQKAFLLHKPFLAGFKNRPFSQTKCLAFTQTFSYSHPKHSFFARCPFQPPLTYCPQKFPIFTNQKPFIRTNLSLLPSKATLFHPPPSIRTTLNLLFAKTAAVLFLFALILCCKAGTSHRFKSLPAIPSEVAAFHKTGYLMIAGHFRKNTVSTGDLNRPRSPEVRKPLGYSPFFSYKRKE